MAVYVDEAKYQITAKGKSYCHCWADTLEELHAFAELIGRKRCWFHRAPKAIKSLWHYDLDEDFRAKALAAGALAVTTREFVASRAGIQLQPSSVS